MGGGSVEIGFNHKGHKDGPPGTQGIWCSEYQLLVPLVKVFVALVVKKMNINLYCYEQNDKSLYV